jgi:hypothetical protein
MIKTIELAIHTAFPDAEIAPHTGQTIVRLPRGAQLWITERELGRVPPPAATDPPVTSIGDAQLSLAEGQAAGRWLIRLRGREAIGIAVRTNGDAAAANAALAAIARALAEAG